MDGGKIGDIDILKIKKKKKGGTEKKKSIPSKITQKSKIGSDINNLLSQKKSGLNLNKKDMNVDISSDNKEIANWGQIKSSLEKMKEMIIKQESDILEAVTGCQEPNNYHVYGRLPNGEKSYIFRCREFSSCGMRFWCPVSCRELIMKVKLAFDEKEEDNNEDNDEEFNNSLLYIEKKFKCPCCNCIIRNY